MNKGLFEKRCRYSIRKLAIGAASVMIGATFFGNQVSADDHLLPMSDGNQEATASLTSEEKSESKPQAPVKAERPVTEKEVEVEPTVAPVSLPDAEKERVTEPVAEKESDLPAETKALDTAPDRASEDSALTSPSAEKTPATVEEKSSKELDKSAAAVDSEKAIEDQLLSERKQDFNKDWYFTLNAKGDASKKDVDVKDWSKLNLPYDWSIYFDFDHQSPARNEGGQLNGGTAWYRKTFTLDEAAKDKDVRIHFDGVYMDSRVYVNGKFVGHYPSGYNHFSYDITDFLHKDGSENSIAVQVTNKQPSSRWYSGSGIYRDVHLSYRDKVHVLENGSKITSPKLAEQKDGAVDTQITSKVENKSSKPVSVYLEQQIFTKAGQAVSELVRSAVKTLAADEVADFDQTIQVNQPTLWTTKSYNPQLYVLKTKVYKDSQLVDVTEDSFGYRYMNWTAKEGFFLNGERLKFHGVSIHHDNGALGAEENYKASYRKLKLLKDMGVNAIRTTHNPASPQLLQAAADLGLLVQEEAFDTWYGGKKTYDYGRFFDQDATHPEAKKGEKWSDFDLRTMVERDKNNPAIIMWSLGNEVDEADGGPRSLETAKRLKAVIKAIDTERYVTMGENKFSRAATGRFLELAAIMDAVGMNYGERHYDAVRAAHPDWLIYGSETSSATRTRDSYYNPANPSIAHDNSAGRHYEQSDYGNDRVGWGKTATESWTFDRDRAGYAGQFIWTGFDYIGEPTPWHNQDRTPVKSSYFGIIDTAGLPKNDFYLYRSEWYSAEEKPSVHILPHWTWTEEALKERKILVDGKVPVRTFSNAASVELYLNDKSLGKKVYTKKTTADGRSYHEGEKPNQLYLEWLVAYEPGTLRAIARDEAGNEIARDEVTTAYEPAAVRLTKEEHVITADGKDLSYIHYEIVDAYGTVVPTAKNLVHFNLHGQGQIVGVDNGEQASRERYKAQPDGSWQRRAFNGKGVIIVKSTEKQGQFTLYADSEGLTSDHVTVQTVSGQKDKRHFVSYAPVKAVLDPASQPDLPQRVTAIYSDGSTEEKAVTWDVPADLTKTAGDKTVLGTVEGLADKAQANLRVVAFDRWLEKTAQVAAGTTSDQLDKTVVAVLSDGSLVETEVESWTLENPDALRQVGGSSKAVGKVVDEELQVTATFRAVSEVESSHVSGIQLDQQALSDFQADQTYYRVTLPYSSSLPTVTASVSGGRVSIQQASDQNDHLASVFELDAAGRLAKTYRIQFVKAAPALTKLALTVDGKDQATEDQSLTYHVTGTYEDGSQVDFQPSELTLTATSTDGGEVQVKGDQLLLYSKGTVSLTASLANQTDSRMSQPLTLTIKENKAVKTITALHPLTLSTDLHSQPNLPSHVMADFDKGLSRKLAVSWEPITAEQLGHYGSFTVKGNVPGTELKAQATVTVEGFLVAEEVSLTVPQGEQVRLPGNVRVYHSNGSTVYKDVIWDSIPETTAEGKIQVVGQVQGSKFKTIAHIRVSADALKETNISRQWTGSQLPAAITSTTGGDDRASSLNDLTISRKNTDTKNRWTTWKTGTDNDWAALLFGDAGDLTKRFVDNLTVDFYTDNAIGLPKDYVIEYYVGKEEPGLPSDLNHASKDSQHPFNDAKNWKEVSNLHKPAKLSAHQGNQFSFDKVETYALRIRMKKADGKLGVGLTELTVLGNKVPAKTNATISIQADGQDLPHFNPEQTDYYIPSKSQSITATASQDGLVTVVPASHADEATRLILKAEDGSILKEYRIFRSDVQTTALPVATEALAMTIQVGDKLVLPSTVPAYYKTDNGWESKNLAVSWEQIPEGANQAVGRFTLTGQLLGSQIKPTIQITVLKAGGQVISDNPQNNALDSKAFASITNDTQPASKDRVHFVNDGGYEESNRWTNWSRTPGAREASVGLLFKKEGKILAQEVDKVSIQFFKDSGTDAPESMVLEYYDGPAYKEPATISRYSEDADHPFNQAANWKTIPYKMEGDLTAGHPITFTFAPVTTTAIRARMNRKASTNGLAMVEFRAYAAAGKQELEAADLAISLDGKALQGFDHSKTSYEVSYKGKRPELTAEAKGSGRVTLLASDSDERPSLVRLLAADGSLLKEYQIHLYQGERILPLDGEASLEESKPSLETVTSEIAYKTIERENKQLPKGERKVISKGQVGQLTEYYQVDGDQRILVGQDSIPAVDQVIEVGVGLLETTPDKPADRPTESSQPDKPADQPTNPSNAAQDLRILQDKETGVAIIGRPAELGDAVSLSVKRVLDQSLMDKVYDAYDIRLLDKDGKEVQPQGAVMVRLPVQTGKTAEQVYYVTPSKELRSLNFTQAANYVEFAATHFSTYAVVYGQVKAPQKSSEQQIQPLSSLGNQGKQAESAPEVAQPSPANQESAKAEQALPNTGESSNAHLIFLASLSLALSTLFYLKGKKK